MPRPSSAHNPPRYFFLFASFLRFALYGTKNPSPLRVPPRTSESSAFRLLPLFRVPTSAFRVSPALLLALLSSSPILARPASFTPLGDLPGGVSRSRANAISADATTVVGFSESSNGLEAFRWTLATGMTPLGDLHSTVSGPLDSVAHAVSGDGSIIVGVGHLASGQPRAFRWQSNTIAELPLANLPAGANSSAAFGLSRDGATAGGISYIDCMEKGCSGHPTVWTDFTPAALPIINAPDAHIACILGVCADGHFRVGHGDQAGSSPWIANFFVTGISDLPHILGGIGYAEGIAVTPDTTVAVGVTASGRTAPIQGHGEAVYWQNIDSPFAMGDLPGGEFYSEARAVADNASVIVGWATTDSGRVAFVWDHVRGMRSLRDVLVNDFALDLTGWTLTEARGISADGLTITGWGVNPSGNEEAWIAHADCLAPVYIREQSFNMTICPGTNAHFNAQMFYTTTPQQWRRDNVPLQDGPTGTGSVISGAHTDTLTITNVSTADNAYYDCVASNICGEVSTIPARLTVGFPGDASGDAAVTIADIAVVVQHWGQTVPPGTLGDISFSGFVGLDDVAIIIRHWGLSCP
ncbi:MAG TPA: hypothetical protein VG797_01905 [Phycisphaerales bacterium]|nr:hypothetical protein [Phycisphaerales bacterium]